MLKFFHRKETYLIDFELIPVFDGNSSYWISPKDFYRFTLDYAENNNIRIKNLIINEPSAKSFIEVTNKSDYITFIDFFQKPCNSKWTRLIGIES